MAQLEASPFDLGENNGADGRPASTSSRGQHGGIKTGAVYGISDIYYESPNSCSRARTARIGEFGVTMIRDQPIKDRTVAQGWRGSNYINSKR